MISSLTEYQGLEVSGSTPEDVFTEWFHEEREPELEEDVDECLEDNYDDDYE